MSRVVQRVRGLLLAEVALQLPVAHPHVDGHVDHRLDVDGVHLEVDEVFRKEGEALATVAALDHLLELWFTKSRVDRSQGVRVDLLAVR